MKETTKNNLITELKQIQLNLGSLEHQLGNLHFKREVLGKEISRINQKKERLTHRGLEIQARLKKSPEPESD